MMNYKEMETLAPEIGLDQDSRDALNNMLNTILADENLIYNQTRSAHWNITGPQFFALHELLEKQYDQLKLQADEIAERVVMLGGRAKGKMSDYLDLTRLAEPFDEFDSWQECINSLRKNHEKVAALLRNNIETAAEEHGDEGTADLLTDTLRMHEEMAWMLRATISG